MLVSILNTFQRIINRSEFLKLRLLIEHHMRRALKSLFKNVMESLKKNLKTRDEWILKWPGQLCITSSQVHACY